MTHSITGLALARLMRCHRVTIRELSRRMQNPMKMIRIARRNGVVAPGSFDYRQAIVGEWTPEMSQDFQQWREMSGR